MNTRARQKVKDLQTALDIYYNNYELGTAEVKKLFDCSDSTAIRLKRQVREVQKKQGMMTFSNGNVNTKLAYKVWGIDIADIEKRVMRYQKIMKGANA